MGFDVDEAVARLLHHREQALEPGDPVSPPIVPTSLYYLPGDGTAPDQYGRWTNPTWGTLEAALSILEDADVVAFPSGMAAIAAVFLSIVRPGDRVLIPSDAYYTTRSFAEQYLAPIGVTVDLCPTIDIETRDLTGYRLVHVETPSNPGLDVCDIRAVVENAKTSGVLVIADNTTMTPLGQRPLDLGADVVVASDTKALNGHADVLFGHVATRDPALAGSVLDWRKIGGAIPGPFEAWLVHRGLESLEVRFDRMCTTARLVAERLANHASIGAVRYPGLPDDPAHGVARRQMARFGSLIGVTFADAETADRFIENARFVLPATSFGGTHTSADRRARWGDQVAAGFVRLSIGVEPTEALWKDFERALDAR